MSDTTADDLTTTHSSKTHPMSSTTEHKESIKKLYEVPRNTRIKLLETPKTPPAAPELEQDQELNFHHIDGMYSYCTTDCGKIVHVAAWTLVEVI